MPIYYCTDAQVTRLLPSNIAGSEIATSGNRDELLRLPTKEWIDSVYPGYAPFPGVSAAFGYLVNQSDHKVGDGSVVVDSGSGTPVAGDQFQAPDDAQVYTITGWANNVISYTPTAKTAFPDNAPLMIGTPSLLQQAAYTFAAHIGFQLISKNPEDKRAILALSRAKGLLRISGSGTARAKPWAGHHMSAVNMEVAEA